MRWPGAKNEKYFAVRKKIYKDAAVTVIAISQIVFMEIVTVIHNIGLIHKKLMYSDIDQLARKHPLFMAEDDTRVLM